MKRGLAMLFVIAAQAASAGDWRADFHAAKPGSFPPPRPQTGTYRFGWGALAAARAEIEFTRQKGDTLQLKLTTKTIGGVRALWQLDAEHTARCEAATLRPITMEQIERYRGETEKTKADFSPEEVARRSESIPAAATRPKTKRFEFPGVLDLQAALLTVRSQRLAVGDRYQFVVYPSRAPYLGRVEVVAKETIEVGGQRYPATKVQLSLQGIDKELKLKPHKKFKNAHGWISDDQDRLLLKVDAEVFVGRVWMELQSIEFADEKRQRTQMPR